MINVITDSTVCKKRVPSRAEDLYMSASHLAFMPAVETLRGLGIPVDTWIVSPIYGVVHGGKIVTRYDASFHYLTIDGFKREVLELNIPSAARIIFSKTVLLNIVICSQQYLCALDVDGSISMKPPIDFVSPTIFIVKHSEEPRLSGSGHGYFAAIGSSHKNSFRCNGLALKGHIAGQIMLRLAGCSALPALGNTETIIKLVRALMPEIDIKPVAKRFAVAGISSETARPFQSHPESAILQPLDRQK